MKVRRLGLAGRQETHLIQLLISSFLLNKNTKINVPFVDLSSVNRFRYFDLET